MRDLEKRKYIGKVDHRPAYYDIKEGYLILGYSNKIRNMNHKELRQTKAKYGNLEKRITQNANQ